jgi:hypothetical protein|tara:strand:- start:3755 stop:3901 length:147 start_codon:yes stop_codon:yes gene_type:complete
MVSYLVFDDPGSMLCAKFSLFLAFSRDKSREVPGTGEIEHDLNWYWFR